MTATVPLPAHASQFKRRCSFASSFFMSGFIFMDGSSPLTMMQPLQNQCHMGQAQSLQIVANKKIRKSQLQTVSKTGAQIKHGFSH